MRTSVGTRGAAGSTFDHVAREAGVSRGLLHYYFGSKEKLLVEVVRHDCETRIEAMDETHHPGRQRDEIVAALVLGLEEFIEGEPSSPAVIYELLSASRHSDEIPFRARRALPALARRPGRRPAREGARRGGPARGGPGGGRLDAVRARDGFGIQVLSDPDWDREAAFELGVRIARRLLGATD